MKQAYEHITKEVRRRVRQYRRRHEQRSITLLGILCLLLTAGILPLLSNAGVQGTSSVLDGYSSVLLHSGASSYVVIGIAAFVAGAAVTMLCLYLKKRNRRKK